VTQGIDATHDPALRSWVETANGHPEFPIQNLPFGVFSDADDAPRGGVAIGGMILDLAALAASGLLDGAANEACAACAGPALNGFLSLGTPARIALRHALSRLLAEGSPARPELLHAAESCVMHLPAVIGDYTDLYAGIHHATNVGKLFRPDSPLMPNYKYVPIGYHGRASSVRPSGTAVRRPAGQRKKPDAAAPSFGPCERLDYELELGIWVGAGNAPGHPIPIGEAHDHIAGFCLLNDWSARDIQAWEYQPLGPFLAKNFHTSVSPWIVTPEAMAPFRVRQPARPEGDPAPLPYLADETDQASGALELTLDVLLVTPGARAQGLPPYRLSRGSATHLYWTPAQMLTHHASNGCDLRPGDLLGTGTISAPTADGLGSLLEITAGGRDRVALPSGETRAFLEDGDEIIMRAHAHRDGYVSIGFGECRGIIRG
jgi:fumarylacetoacetase